MRVEFSKRRIHAKGEVRVNSRLVWALFPGSLMTGPEGWGLESRLRACHIDWNSSSRSLKVLVPRRSAKGSRTPTGTQVRYMGALNPFLLCSHLAWIMHTSPREIIPRIRILSSASYFFFFLPRRLRRSERSQSLFRRETNGYRPRSRAPSERNDPSLGIRIRREREIEFTVHVERDGGVVKIDYDIIICARARRLKRTDRCNDGIMLL